MAERGYECVYLGTNSFTEELRRIILQFVPGHIVLPIHQLEGNFPVDILEKEMRLYVGVASKEWVAPFMKSDIQVHYYLQDEQFIWRNAWLTAEAFLKEYYSSTGRVISGERFYIAGFGRVGKMVARLVASLGADVTILARSNQQLGEAEAYRYAVKRLKPNMELEEGFLINTIPARWLSEANNAKCHIFDLASAPGCLASVTIPEYYRILPGLPGKHFPVDAADALADALERIYRR